MEAEKEISTKSCAVFTIATIFYLYELVLRVSPSVMTGELMSAFNATSTTLGVLVSFYYYAYTAMQLPCGVILDRIGPRNLLGFSTVLCVIGSLLFAGTAGHLLYAQIGRFFVGAGSACAFISCLQIAANLFPIKYFAILAGITNMMGTVGGLLGGPPVAKSVNAIGWQNTTYYLAIIGVVITVLIFTIIPKDIVNNNVEKRQKKHIPITSTVTKLLKNPQIVLPGIIASFMYLPIDAFAELWAVPFFMAKYNIDNEYASFASAAVFIGVAIGSVLLAILARKINSYMKTIRISSLLTAILFIPLIFYSCNVYVSFAIVLIIGFFTGAQPIGFTCAKNNAASEISGTTLALTNCIVMLIGSIFQPFLGVLLDYFWNGEVNSSGLRVYDINCYKYSIMIIPICLVFSFLLSLFVKETIQLEKDNN